MGIGRKLTEKAIKSLKKRGMEKAEVLATEKMKNAKKLFESMDFELVRILSEMKIKLDTVPLSIGENEEVTKVNEQKHRRHKITKLAE